MMIQLIFREPWHKKLLPIQSLRQVIDTVVIALVIGILCTKILFPWPEGLFVTVVFGWIGTLPIMALALPATLAIETDKNNSKNVLNFIERVLFSECYKNINSGDARTLKFTARLPQFLKWKEGDIEILIDGAQISICGPIFVLRLIKRRLELQETLQNSF